VNGKQINRPILIQLSISNRVGFYRKISQARPSKYMCNSQ